jgi:HD-GYP domain-containing protein (c-di-GMP phosphodiesterase class II)
MTCATTRVPSAPRVTPGPDALPTGAFLLQVGQDLLESFGRPFYLFDPNSGSALFDDQVLPPPPPAWEEYLAPPSNGKLSKKSAEPVILHSDRPLIVIKLEVPGPLVFPVIAVGVFVSHVLTPPWVLARKLVRIGFCHKAAARLARQLSQGSGISKQALLQIGRLFLREHELRHLTERLHKENKSLAGELAATYEEISLLHRLAANLRLSQTDEELTSIALTGMEETIPAEGLAILLFPPGGEHEDSAKLFSEHSTGFFSRGRCPLDAEKFLQLARYLNAAESPQPVVCNRNRTNKPDWNFPEVRQVIVAPLLGGKECFGYLGAFNHRHDCEFGTVEASLVGSVAAILGSHTSNLLLYRQLEDSISGMIRALTSAIDAKDAYTCGHSDRVARVAVRLAQEMGIEGRGLQTIYLAGLLHDIGKIGTSELVLRKPGKLTPEEYEHIKQHVRDGYRILMDLKHLAGVLPAVLHHHEHWDGTGYPAGLAGEEIPLAARIIAVADAFDAMRSDRPYRPRMPDEKIDQVLRQGANKQWDPAIIEAFFRIRHEIDAIVLGEPGSLPAGQFALRPSSFVQGAVPAAVLTPR